MTSIGKTLMTETIKTYPMDRKREPEKEQSEDHERKPGKKNARHHRLR